MEQERCLGCGAVLQCEDPDKPGYLPKKIYLERSSHLCKRCFRLQHYGEESLPSTQTQLDIKLLEKAKRDHALVIYVVDLFLYPFMFFEKIHSFLQEIDILMIANKRDLLPKSLKDERLRLQILHLCKEKELKVKDVLILSTKRGEEKEYFVEKALQEAKNRDLYFVGIASSGKSSLINLLLKNVSLKENMSMTTSIFPGTTLETIQVKLPSHHVLYDTPGLEDDHCMESQVEKKILPLFMPKKEIKARIYQLQSQQSLHLGGLARCDFLQGERSAFVVYASSSVQIVRSKLENAEKTFFSLIQRQETTPVSKQYQKKEDFEEREFSLQDGTYRITIAGYAWLQIKAKKIKIRLILPQKVKVDCSKEK